MFFCFLNLLCYHTVKAIIGFLIVILWHFINYLISQVAIFQIYYNSKFKSVHREYTSDHLVEVIIILLNYTLVHVQNVTHNFCVMKCVWKPNIFILHIIRMKRYEYVSHFIIIIIINVVSWAPKKKRINNRACEIYAVDFRWRSILITIVYAIRARKKKNKPSTNCLRARGRDVHALAAAIIVLTSDTPRCRQWHLISEICTVATVAHRFLTRASKIYISRYPPPTSKIRV
jgi:hypothetical protein